MDICCWNNPISWNCQRYNNGYTNGKTTSDKTGWCRRYSSSYSPTNSIENISEVYSGFASGCITSASVENHLTMEDTKGH